MATRFVFTPESAHFPSSAFAVPMLSNRRPVLAFASSTSAYWTFVAPQGLTGPLVAVITLAAATATSGAAAFNVAVEAISDGDSVDTDAATSFDANNSGSINVPATAGFPVQLTITLTNDDGIAPGDYCRIQLARQAGGASGNILVLEVELRDAA